LNVKEKYMSSPALAQLAEEVALAIGKEYGTRLGRGYLENRNNWLHLNEEFTRRLQDGCNRRGLKIKIESANFQTTYWNLVAAALYD
jgi:hypothetical protein